MIKTNLYKNGKSFAVTFSYDDGSHFDEKLIGIFNQYGIKGTFHLNSGKFGTSDYYVGDIGLYDGHEVACHGVTHANLPDISKGCLIPEIFNDRLSLEKLAGYPVVGHSYAYGGFNDSVIESLKGCGIVYSRTTQSTNSFDLPEDFMKWHPTYHHRDALETIDRFIKLSDRVPLLNGKLLYIWGHSFEFDRNNNWELIEEICEKISGRDNIWYATNIEIYEYVTALRRLVISADGKMAYNPSAVSVWVDGDGTVYEIKPGETLIIN